MAKLSSKMPVITGATTRIGLPPARHFPALNGNASLVSDRAIASTAVYSASTAALAARARATAIKLATRGVRVNLGRPGPIATPIHEKTGLPVEACDAFVQYAPERVPLGRCG